MNKWLIFSGLLIIHWFQVSPSGEASTKILQQRGPSKYSWLTILYFSTSACYSVALQLCPTRTHTHYLILIAGKAHSQHFLLAMNTEALSTPLPAAILHYCLPPWKHRAWLSIRQPDTNCVCSLLYWASHTHTTAVTSVNTGNYSLILYFATAGTP